MHDKTREIAFEVAERGAGRRDPKIGSSIMHGSVATWEAGTSPLAAASTHRSRSAFLSPVTVLLVKGRSCRQATSSPLQHVVATAGTRRSSTKLQQSIALLSAATKRGALATPAQRKQVELIVDELALLPQSGSGQSVLPGQYALLWATTRSTFRSSIFFWAFQQAFSGPKTRAAAATAFRVTGALPGVHVHSAVQDVSHDEIRSVVDLEIWPGFRGDVVSTGRLAHQLISGSTAEVRVETTRIERSNYLPVPAVWAAPVGLLFDLISGDPASGATATFTILFSNADGYALRVPGKENGGSELFVYERVR